ncbi:MAG TPA: ABC transporter permease [Candidatus Limnocylindrales bacterium]|jgi:ABC-2 type transport system permease protein
MKFAAFLATTLGGKLDRNNVVAVARREYLARARTRTFKLTTVLLVVVGVGAALSPLLFRYLDRGTGQTTIEVWVGGSNPAVDVVTGLSAFMNAAGTGASGTPPATPRYRIVAADGLDSARARVLAGDTAGLLVVGRAASGNELTFEYVTTAAAFDRVPQIVSQAAGQLAIQERLSNAGVPPAEQGQLFAPPTYTVTPADPNAKPGASPEEQVGGFAIGFVLAIILFMAIVLYGQWIAYSVVEEKSSRVMEVILGAATPFELLSGKVVGVGALALTQYAIVFVPATIALLLQSQIAAVVLGGSADAGSTLPAGLSIPLLLAFGVFFVFGFAMYAVLYAGAAALVSRTEDINQIVAPMTLVSTAGYLVAVYSSTGLLDANSTFVVVMSYIPFFSPYLMLSRLGAGLVGPVEVLVAMALLAISVPLALWVAARFYAAGVLMYGQRPSLRLMLRVLRHGAR